MGEGTRSPAVFEKRFREAFALALAEGAPDVGVARSRAAVMTLPSAAGLVGGPRMGEEIRARVFREECKALGVQPLSAPAFNPSRADLAAAAGIDAENRRKDETCTSVPRGRPSRDGEHPRRSGKR